MRPYKAPRGLSRAVPSHIRSGAVFISLPHQTTAGPKITFTYRIKSWEASRRHIESLQGPQKALKGFSQPDKVWCGIY